MSVPSNVAVRLRTAAYRWYYRLNDVAHRYRIWARPRRAHGVRFRSYEPLGIHCRDDLLRALCAELEPRDVVFDVGANTGVYALAAAASEPSAGVIAFEPNPTVADRLRANVAANGSDERVAVREEGVGDEDGEATFHVSSYDELGSFRADHAAALGADVIDEIGVPVVRLDDLLEAGEIPAPDHLKVDVEGFGREVLAGARSLLEDERPIVYFEPHEDTAERSTGWLRSTFDALGYEPERVAEGWVFRP